MPSPKQTLLPTTKHIAKLHFITGEYNSSHVRLAEEACKGGVDWIQLRIKRSSYDTWKTIAEEVQGICKRYGATLIIDDHVALAREISADGVHLGQEDMPTDKARDILGEEAVIGGTANTMDQIRDHATRGVDYIGLGPYRFTGTKDQKRLSPVLGVEGYRQLVAKCSEEGIELPLIAIGDIRMDDVQPLLQTGVHGVAVSSAIAKADDVAATAEYFARAVQKVAIE
jgi:thiamine-phosphate pyrophosphorylase